MIRLELSDTALSVRSLLQAYTASSKEDHRLQLANSHSSVFMVHPEDWNTEMANIVLY